MLFGGVGFNPKTLSFKGLLQLFNTMEWRCTLSDFFGTSFLLIRFVRILKNVNLLRKIALLEKLTELYNRRN